MLGIVGRGQDFDQKPQGFNAVQERGPDRGEQLTVGVLHPAGQRHIIELNDRPALYRCGADPQRCLPKHRFLLACRAGAQRLPCDRQNLL
jgi:hypothetical protein